MARAYGSSAHLLMKRETVYGQAATGNYVRMPFNRCNLGSEQGLVDAPVLGQGRDPLAPLQDVINNEGDIVVRVDPRYLGLWLTGLFGDPDTTDNLDGSWDHEFASGGEDLLSYTIEVGMAKVPAFFLHVGVKLNSIALEFTRSGPAAAAINAIAQGETRFGTTQGGTPTSLTFSRISQFQGSIKRAGSPVGNLTGGSVTYSNNLERIETRRRSDHRRAHWSHRCPLRRYDADRLRGRRHASRPRVRVHALGAGEARADRARGLPAETQACGRGPGRRAGELRLSWREERRRRAHA
jgi:hypothetical protein